LEVFPYHLPKDLIQAIFEYLSLSEMAKAARTCKLWKEAVDNREDLWRILYLNNWPISPRSSTSSEESNYIWKQLFKERYIMEEKLIKEEVWKLMQFQSNPDTEWIAARKSPQILLELFYIVHMMGKLPIEINEKISEDITQFLIALECAFKNTVNFSYYFTIKAILIAKFGCVPEEFLQFCQYMLSDVRAITSLVSSVGVLCSSQQFDTNTMNSAAKNAFIDLIGIGKQNVHKPAESAYGLASIPSWKRETARPRDITNFFASVSKHQ